ncbi:glycosyltransferase [Nostoc sp. FACHB-87]|uniref:glycosyltransferase n=1 Tax=Nostocaceae TaxID=1162 RepID=UPI0016883857|nr:MULTISPECIES: glycosyltransferase [Nostocaceae]MBD2454932.1 glycosyltransferase [Nostoc sp. FACHB-87]MBD2474747.1 glycosyltransferase [Anabaena sp. FACHB-83]
MINKSHFNSSLNIQNWGTFDVSNYGDLLFPLILDSELKKRISGIDITLYSPKGGQFEPELNRTVKRIIRIEEEGFFNQILNYRGIILGGGDIIRFDDAAMVPIYEISQELAEQERSYRVFIEDLAKLSQFIPVIWNAVGIPFEFDEKQSSLVRRSIDKITYISVRDDLCKQKLIEAGINKEIHVVPDTAFLISRYYPKSILEDTHKRLIQTKQFPGFGKVLCLQVSYASIQNIEELITAINSIILTKPELEIVFLPIGLCHNDQLILRKLQEGITKRTFLLEGNIDIKMIASVIAHSDYFAGTSLHGNITAYSYGIPNLLLNFSNLEKLKGVAMIMCIENIIITTPKILKSSLLNLIQQQKQDNSNLSRIFTKIDKHFDRVAEILQTSPKLILDISEAIQYVDDASKAARFYITNATIKSQNKQIEELKHEIQEINRRLERSHSQLQHTHYELERSQIVIAAMESSKFWQMRTVWFNFRRAIGFVNPNVSFRQSLFSRVKYLLTIFRVKGLSYLFYKIFKKIFFNFNYTLNPVLALPGVPHANDIDYQRWLNINYPTQDALKKMPSQVDLLTYKPLISIVMPVFNTPANFLREAIDSVLNQAYPYWELCIADDASTDNQIRQILEDYSSKDSRIKVVFRNENGHISRCSNSALELASGEFISLLDHDDILTPDALYEVALLLNQHPDADMIYSDEDKMAENGNLQDPFFKPDWCPDSFLSRMYTCHLATYRRELVEKIGGFRIGYEGSQDYDLVLRLTEKTTRIFHIPKILYHWRIHPQSAASKADQKPYAVIAAEKALADALVRRGEDGRVTEAKSLAEHHIIRYTIKDYKLVSIIIPTRDLGNTLDKCLTSIFEKTTYPNYEIILIDNGSQEENTFRIFSKWQQKEPNRFQCHRLDIPFNYPKINNYAVNQTKGDYLLFLNNDIEVITPDWIDAMVEQAQRPSIGAVGALLLYPDDTIQHAGVVIGIGGVAGHSHKNYPSDSPGYFDQIATVNNYSALTAACLMCRREVFEAVEGFEEKLAVAFNDVDLCLKIVEKGYRNIYLPHVMLYHYESKSRGYEDTPEKQARFLKETEYMQNKWKKFIDYDPCYSINLTSKHEDYSLKLE